LVILKLQEDSEHLPLFGLNNLTNVSKEDSIKTGINLRKNVLPNIPKNMKVMMEIKSVSNLKESTNTVVSLELLSILNQKKFNLKIKKLILWKFKLMEELLKIKLISFIIFLKKKLELTKFSLKMKCVT